MENNFPFNHFINIPEKTSHPIAQNIEPQTSKRLERHEDVQLFTIEELDFVSKKILDQIQEKIPSIKFNTFFNDTFMLTDISYNLVTFATSTDYIKTIIENSYLPIIADSIVEILGKEYEVLLKVTSTNKSLSSNNKNILNTINHSKSEHFGEEAINSGLKSSSAKDASFTIDLIPTKEDKIDSINSKVINHLSNQKFKFLVDPKKTFDTYVVGPSNNMAYASAHAVAKNPGRVYPCLYLHSNSGLGKTHLLHAVANKIKEDNPTLIICITTARDFMSEMVDAMANNKILEFRRKYSEDIDVLMIDDVHELKNKHGTQNEFFHVFNELHNKGRQLIFTSDKHPKDIDGIEERIKTRLSWGLVLDIQQPDLETRIAILKKKAAHEDIYLPQDVINLIATSIKTNIRELEGSLIRLAAYASVFNVDIDIEIAKEQLNLGDIREQDFTTMETVTKTVSLYFKIPIADLKSKSRLKEVALARHTAMFLTYTLVKPTPTYVEIGKFFGGRDHTSVLHAVEKIKKLSKTNQQTSQALLEIENNL